MRLLLPTAVALAVVFTVLGDQAHPDTTCLLPLALICLENGSNISLDIDSAVRIGHSRYIASEHLISPECRLSFEEESSLCDRTGNEGRRAMLHAARRLVNEPARASEKYLVPPMKTTAQFQMRKPEMERNKAGGQVWQDWKAVAGTLVRKTKTFFEAIPPAAPQSAPRAEDPTRHTLQLVWEANTDQPESAPVQGYLIEWQRLSRADGAASLDIRELCRQEGLSGHRLAEECLAAASTSRPVATAKQHQILEEVASDPELAERLAARKGELLVSVSGGGDEWFLQPSHWIAHWEDGGWGDALASIDDRAPHESEGCCTWSTDTRWLLGDKDLLHVGAFRFRVRAVNRMGASGPSPASEIMIWPPPALPAAPSPAPSQERGSEDGAEGGQTTQESGAFERAPTDPFANGGTFYHFQSKPPMQRLVADDEAAKSIYEMSDGFSLEGDYTKLGFIYFYGVLTGRYNLVLDSNGAPSPAVSLSAHEQEVEKATPLPDNETKHDIKDACRVPLREWFAEPLTPELEHPRTPDWLEEPVTQENVTAMKLIIAGQVCSYTNGGNTAPFVQPELYALLTVILTFLEMDVEVRRRRLQVFRASGRSLPVFPIARNRAAIGSSTGVRFRRGQVWTFLKESFAWASEVSEWDLLLQARMPLANPFGGNARDKAGDDATGSEEAESGSGGGTGHATELVDGRPQSALAAEWLSRLETAQVKKALLLPNKAIIIP